MAATSLTTGTHLLIVVRLMVASLLRWMANRTGLIPRFHLIIPGRQTNVASFAGNGLPITGFACGLLVFSSQQNFVAIVTTTGCKHSRVLEILLLMILIVWCVVAILARSCLGSDVSYSCWIVMTCVTAVRTVNSLQIVPMTADAG